MAYSCPVKGCAKRGTRSSLHQHFSAKHTDLAQHYDWAHIDLFIQTGREITMPITIEKDIAPRLNKLALAVAFAAGIVFGVIGYHMMASSDFKLEMSSPPPAVSKPDKR